MSVVGVRIFKSSVCLQCFRATLPKFHYAFILSVHVELTHVDQLRAPKGLWDLMRNQLGAPWSIASEGVSQCDMRRSRHRTGGGTGGHCHYLLWIDFFLFISFYMQLFQMLVRSLT